MVAEQDVAVGLQLVSVLSSGEGCTGRGGLVCPVLQASGASAPSGRFQ